MAAFCADHHARVLGLVAARVGDHGVAEELAQDVLVAVCDRWERVRSADDPTAYVLAMARNRATSAWRRVLAGRRATARLAARTGQDVPDGPHAAVESRPALVAALARLTPREREVLVLRFVADLDVERTAGVLGVRPGTVRSLTHRALQKLRTDPSVVSLREADTADPSDRRSRRARR